MPGIKVYKLKAATLMEVLIAIAIIMTVITISTMIFLNVTASSFTGEKLHSALLMNEISIETKKSKTYFDEELVKDNIVIRKQLDKYGGQSDLLLLHLSAFNQNQKLLGEWNELLLVESE